jgi:hypothetical protein
MIKGAGIMLKMKQGLRLIAILVGVAGASFLVPSQAAPPSGGVPAGRIFYIWDSALTQNGHESRGFWSMNADGSGKQLLAYQPHMYDYAELSHQVHQGHRWYLEFRTSPIPINGVAVFAVRDDGHPDFTVLLADPSGMELGDLCWARDDSFISIVARPQITNPDGTYSDDPNALDGIYAAEIAFDPNTGLPTLTTALEIVAEVEQPGDGIWSHDWSPDGNEVVYRQSFNNGTTSAMIADTVTGTTRLLAANGYNPVWSPDGTRIAYSVSGNIYVNNPAGTAVLKITNNGWDSTVGWSLDSRHVLFNRGSMKNNKGVYDYLSDVLRVPATGGTAVNLTKDIDGYAWAKYWR